jgi:DNA-binding Lrp family transcriptional regulator
MKKREQELIIQLLRHSKLSDREIAKKLNTSQSTITRIRHRLEKKFINSYTIVPNLSKLGIELIAFTFTSCSTPTPKFVEEVNNFLQDKPNVVFAGHGEGLKKTCIIISFHKNFSDLTKFLRTMRLLCKGFGETVESFIVSTDNLIRTLDMTRAIESIIKKD